MTQDEVWYRLEVLTSNPEAVGSVLWSHSALGVEVQDLQTYMEDGSIPPVPEGMTRLIAFFAAPFPTCQLTEDVRVVSHSRYDDRSWETAWKKFFRPVRVSRRVVVGPPWESFEAPADGVRIVIEPGMAFGTGTHETTGICAELLDELIESEAPDALLDVGCGTGVLSMMGKMLGVELVHGTDIDSTAVEVALQNLVENGLEGQIAFSTSALGELGMYDLVVANILAHILENLRDELVNRVIPGGLLVTSGITTAQAEEFRSRFSAAPLELVERRDQGEWVAFVWRRE